jgi:hypothetical protein
MGLDHEQGSERCWQGLVPLLNNPSAPAAGSGWWPFQGGGGGGDALLGADVVPPPLTPGRLPAVHAADFNRCAESTQVRNHRGANRFVINITARTTAEDRATGKA